MSELQIQMSFGTWILFFVGNSFTPERVLEKLQSMEDQEHAKKIWKKLKRDRVLGDDFKGFKLNLKKNKEWKSLEFSKDETRTSKYYNI
ncbi:hypothetical protein MAL08_19505 (plasmid) [Leptospira noguchii]|uniref:hypothetical protein n=1 Tax=Leptospira noguchii TaxID=28182 RepID=UPI001FB6C2D1|nr:hypothetical protein [Leptospira noguchii]UOG40000.1 hypothetical protein MAL08_19505 [Leptospira noguchii]